MNYAEASFHLLPHFALNCHYSLCWTDNFPDWLAGCVGADMDVFVFLEKEKKRKRKKETWATPRESNINLKFIL